jgi:hypothetical protein
VQTAGQTSAIRKPGRQRKHQSPELMTIEGRSASQAGPTWNAITGTAPGLARHQRPAGTTVSPHRLCPGQTVRISRHRKRRERLPGPDSCAEQHRPAIAARVDSWVRPGRGCLQLVIVAMAGADDVAEALDLAGRSFRTAASDDAPGGTCPALLPRSVPAVHDLAGEPAAISQAMTPAQARPRTYGSHACLASCRAVDPLCYCYAAGLIVPHACPRRAGLCAIPGCPGLPSTATWPACGQTSRGR